MKSAQRVRSAWSRFNWLRDNGVTIVSAAALPLRRRLPWATAALDVRPGGHLESDASDLLPMFEEVWVDGVYLPPRWEPGPSPVVVDVGANVGVFAIWAATRLQASRVLAIEPSAATARCLTANVERNRLGEVEVLRLALGGQSGSRELHARGMPSMSTLFRSDPYGGEFLRESERVQVVTLDEIFERCKVTQCDLLKLDCEGSEYEILFNASPATLARIHYIAGEYHLGMNEYGVADLRAFLESSGFDFVLGRIVDSVSGYFYGARRA